MRTDREDGVIHHMYVPVDNFAESAANDLTHAALDPVAKIPEYKACAVAIEGVSPEVGEACAKAPEGGSLRSPSPRVAAA